MSSLRCPLRIAVPLAALAALVLACGPASGPAPAAPPAAGAAPLAAAATATPPPALRKLTVANTSLSLATPLLVAQQTGSFTRHGLDVDVPFIVGVRSVQALVAQQVEFALITSRTTADAAVAGADLVMLASMAPTLSFVLFGQPGLTRPADLRGKTVGIVGFGGSADFAARYSLRRFGLEPERDYALFQTGGMPESLAAVQSGGIDAAVLNAENTVPARRAGLSPVLDITALGIDYVFGALAAERAFLAREPDTTRRLLMGVLEGIHFAKTEPAATKQIMVPHYKTEDQEVLDGAYALIVERLLQRVPYVSAAGVKTVLDEMANEVPAARSLPPERLIDNTWLADLEAGGFVKQLWGN